MKNIIKILAGLFFAILCILPAKAIEPTAPLHLFVLAGQSNMAGTAPLPSVQETSGNVLNWQGGAWVQAIEPIQSTNLAGPGMGFGMGLLGLEGNNYHVGLIPCAVSGSSIEQWQRGQSVYQDCLSKTLAALGTQTPGATLSGVLFAQGEANTYTQSSADGWVSHALQFARDFRTDAGLLSVPFLYAQLGPDPQDTQHPYWTYLQSLQPSLMDPSRPYIRMVATRDLPNIAQHFADAETYAIVGKRFAAVYYVSFGQ